MSYRIVGTTIAGREKYYLTKGDANNVVDDELVPENNVYGKILLFVPIIGKIVLFYKNPLGLILGTVLPTLLYLFGRITPFIN